MWALSALIAVATTVAYLGGIRTMGPFASQPWHIPWPALAALFFVTEVFVVHVHFRAEAHSISVSELVLVLGLFFASPQGMVLAQVVGAAVALTVVRKQRSAKLVFNLANLTLQCVLVLLIFHAVVGANSPDSETGWIAAIVATEVASAVGIANIVGAILLSKTRLSPRRSARTLAMGLVATFTTTNVAVIGIAAVIAHPYLGVPLVVMAGVLVLAYRAYGRERSRRDSLAFLYRASQVTQGTGDLDEIVVSLLEHVREMFNAEVAELVVLGDDSEAGMLRTTVGLDDEPEVMVDAESVLTPVAVEVAKASIADIASLPIQHNGHRPLGTLMVARLTHEDRAFGLLLAARRADAISTFSKDHLRLFETLANHVTMTLVNGKLERSIAQLRELQRQLSHKALHDPITGLANRDLLRAHLETALEDGRTGLAVLFIDLDDFKTVNDTLGHPAGDRLLSVVAARIAHCARSGDTAARLGGDEFAVLLHEAGDGGSEAAFVASRILSSLRVPIVIDGRPVSTQASIGIALVDQPGDAERFMQNADIAMYRAKRVGKGRFEFFAGEMGAEVTSRHALKEDLRGATTRHEFENHYQTIVDVATGRVMGVESLVRWHHPRAGLIGPDEFIALAEETGDVVAIGRQVLEAACRDGARWRALLPGISVSVNVSVRQVLDGHFADDLARTLAVAQLPAEALTIEITESMTVGEVESVVDTLRDIRALGIRIALDDFGTGYSALSEVRRLPIDALKIPKPFIDPLGGTAEDGKSMALVDAIARLAQTLGLEVVAEGIEKPEQYERLKRLPVDGGQGFLFCRPVAADEMARLLVADSAAACVASFDRRTGSAMAGSGI